MIITTDGEGKGATLWVSRDGETWMDFVSWQRKRDGRHATVRVAHKDKCTFYLSKINVAGYNNSIIKISLN